MNQNSSYDWERDQPSTRPRRCRGGYVHTRVKPEGRSIGALERGFWLLVDSQVYEVWKGSEQRSKAMTSLKASKSSVVVNIFKLWRMRTASTICTPDWKIDVEQLHFLEKKGNNVNVHPFTRPGRLLSMHCVTLQRSAFRYLRDWCNHCVCTIFSTLNMI